MVLSSISIAMGLAEAFAPNLIKHFAGEKASNVAKQVIDLGKQITGETDPAKLADALSSNPEYQLQFEAQANDLEKTLAELDTQDAANARDRDVKLHQLGFDNQRADRLITGDITGLVLSVVALVIFATLEVLIEDAQIPGVVWSLFGGLATHFGNGWLQAHNFEFGSSRGSKAKSLQLGGKNGLD